MHLIDDDGVTPLAAPLLAHAPLGDGRGVLAQPEDRWKPFEPPARFRAFFPESS